MKLPHMEQAPRYGFALEQREKYPEYNTVHPSVEIPPWVTIGKNVAIHKGCTIGTQGFGFAWDKDGHYLHIPHIGTLIIEDDVEIFENCNIARATVASTVIGKGTKLDALCHVAHNCRLGHDCFLAAGAILGGSVVLGNGVYVGLNTVITAHAEIADKVFIGSGSGVINNIDVPNSVWAGCPARYIRERRPEEM